MATNFKYSSGKDVSEGFVTYDYVRSVYPYLPADRQRLAYYFNGTDPMGTILTSSQIINNVADWSSLKIGMNAITTHLCLIKNTNTLWTWGDNTYGQLGNGNRTARSSPVQVGVLTNWKSVACGFSYTVATKTDNTLWTWGYNINGQLGNGNRTPRSSPVQVGALTNWSQVSCGYGHTAAVKTDGTLWTWGYNTYGQLGSGTTTSRSSPVQVGALTDWKSIVCGYTSCAATKTDGSVWWWGALGSILRSSPIQIGSITDWKSVAVGYSHMLLLNTNGTIWSLGLNSYGELGNGTTNSTSSPVQIGTLTNWKSIWCSHGGETSFGIKTDGTLWGWGRGTYGNIIVPQTTSYSSPVQIGSFTNWKSVVAGVAYTGIIRDITGI